MTVGTAIVSAPCLQKSGLFLPGNVASGAGTHVDAPFDTDELLGAELHEDGHTVTVTSDGASVGRALVGRALFGVADEVIGGVTGPRASTSTGFVDRVDLRLTIKDVASPTWDMCLWFGHIDRNSVAYQQVSARGRTCVAPIQAAIALAADERGKHSREPPDQSSPTEK